MILTYIEPINYIKTNNFTQLSYCLVHQLFLYQSLIHGFRKPHWPFKAKMQRGLYLWAAVRGPESPLTHLRVWLFCLTLGGPNSEAGFRNPVLILNCKTNCVIRDRLLPCSLSTLISSKCKMSRLNKRTLTTNILGFGDFKYFAKYCQHIWTSCRALDDSIKCY